MAIYRDALEGLRNRVRSLQSGVAQLEKEIERAGTELAIRAQLDAVRGKKVGFARVVDRIEDQERLMRMCDGLEQYRPALTELADRIAAAQAIWKLVGERGAEPVAAAPFWPTTAGALVPPDIGRWQQELLAIFAGLSMPAAVKRDEEARAPTVWARFLHDGAPLSMVVQAGPDGRQVVAVAAPAPTATGTRLRLGPELARHWLLKGVGLVSEIELGDATFDGMFIIRGERDAATRLLGAPTRKALLAVARTEIPQLEVGDRRVEVRWRYDYSAQTIGGAAAALANIYRDTGGEPIDPPCSGR